jgi:hypothetical protein
MYDLRDGTLPVAEPDRLANAGYGVDIERGALVPPPARIFTFIACGRDERAKPLSGFTSSGALTSCTGWTT